jgi:hypothetical protein
MSTESTLLQQWGSVVLWRSTSRGRVYMKEEGQAVSFKDKLENVRVLEKVRTSE